MVKDNWVTVEQAPLEAVAEMMRGRLEAEGIEAVLRGNRVAGAAGIVNEFNISWSNPLGGVEVRVRPEDVEKKRARFWKWTTARPLTVRRKRRCRGGSRRSARRRARGWFIPLSRRLWARCWRR